MIELNKRGSVIQQLSNLWVIPPALFYFLPPEKFEEPAKEIVKSAFNLDKRVKIYGEDNIPKEGPVYFICEHRHILDPVFLVASVFDLTGIFTHYIMRDNFFGGLINPWARKYFESILFPRDDPYKHRKFLKKVLEDVANVLHNSGCVAICPGATRSQDGDIYFLEPSDIEIKNFKKQKERGEIDYDINSLEFRIDLMTNRAASFLKKFKGNLQIVPVGITFNDVNKNIYYVFGLPIEYKTKTTKEEKHQRVKYGVEQLASLKVVGPQLIPYFFHELRLQDKEIQDYFGLDEGISISNIHKGLTKVINELSTKHSFFDVDLYNKEGKLFPEQAVLQQYLEYFVKNNILIRSNEGRYTLNPEKAEDVEINKKFKDRSPIPYDENEIKYTNGITEAYNNAFLSVINEDETNLF